MIANTKLAWGWPAIVLHWVAAVLIILLLGHGWWMTHMAPRPDRLAHYAGHAGLGYDLLALLVLRRVWRCLMQIKPKKRIVFVLHEIEGMSGPEIAEMLSASEATVRSRLHHARRELMALLAKEEGR